MTQRRSMTSLYKAGEHGRNRVRLLADPRTGVLQLEYRDEHGRKARTSTKTRDVATGKAMADELAARLAVGDRPYQRKPPTLRQLFDMYDGDVGSGVAPRKRAQDRHAAENLCGILGATTRVYSLTPADARRFMAERRRRGDQRTRKARPVGIRTVGFEVKVLKAALTWAVREVLIDRSPLDGFRVPAEKNPRRPVLTGVQYAALIEVAQRVHPYCPALLVLAHETGHRLGALLALRWEDVNTRAALVTWRAYSDKGGREHVTPLTAAAIQALDQRAAALLTAGGRPEGPVFPRRDGSPTRRDIATQWWIRMERLAGLPHEPGRGWHSLRRQWTSELAPHVPLQVLARLGGWQDHMTLVKCYVLPDTEQLREALERRA